MKKYVLSLTVAVALAGCSINNDSGQATEHWNNFRQTDITTAGLPDNQALAVFYRETDVEGPNINVYIDGNYQASLRPNSVSPAPVCAKEQQLYAAFSNNKNFGNDRASFAASFVDEQIAYIKVTDAGQGELGFELVDDATGKAAVANLPTVNHTLARAMPKDCEKVVVDNVTINAEALFEFNKYHYDNILPAGKDQINELVAKLAEMKDVTELEVKGYTDPMGSISYNEGLSQRRAESVQHALEQAGVKLPIAASGYGETNLVVADCAEKFRGNKAEIKACNQPNRRVEITLFGIQENK